MTEPVSRQPISDFVREDLAQLASQTLLLLQPEQVGVHVELLLFHRSTTSARFLVHELSSRPFVARIEEVSGVFNVLVEVVTPTRAEANAIAEEFTADERLILLERIDRTGQALTDAARALYALR